MPTLYITKLFVENMLLCTNCLLDVYKNNCLEFRTERGRGRGCQYEVIYKIEFIFEYVQCALHNAVLKTYRTAIQRLQALQQNLMKILPLTSMKLKLKQVPESSEMYMSRAT